MTKTTRARYTLEFKQEAVRLVEGGQSIAAAARTQGQGQFAPPTLAAPPRAARGSTYLLHGTLQCPSQQKLEARCTRPSMLIRCIPRSSSLRYRRDPRSERLRVRAMRPRRSKAVRHPGGTSRLRTTPQARVRSWADRCTHVESPHIVATCLLLVESGQLHRFRSRGGVEAIFSSQRIEKTLSESIT